MVAVPPGETKRNVQNPPIVVPNGSDRRKPLVLQRVAQKAGRKTLLPGGSHTAKHTEKSGFSGLSAVGLARFLRNFAIT
jgi:hypothetical protein